MCSADGPDGGGGRAEQGVRQSNWHANQLQLLCHTYMSFPAQYRQELACSPCSILAVYRNAMCKRSIHVFHVSIAGAVHQQGNKIRV